MAEGAVADPLHVTTLIDALRLRFPGSGLSSEQIRKDRYRVILFWEGLEEMDHPERQQLVWDLADSILPKSDLMKIGMIMTLSPSDVAGPDEEPTE